MDRSTPISEVSFMEESSKHAISGAGVKNLGEYLDLSTKYQRKLCPKGLATEYYRQSLAEGVLLIDNSAPLNPIQYESMSRNSWVYFVLDPVKKRTAHPTIVITAREYSDSVVREGRVIYIVMRKHTVEFEECQSIVKERLGLDIDISVQGPCQQTDNR